MSTKTLRQPRGVQYRKKKPRSIQVAPAGGRRRGSQESKEDDEDEEGGRRVIDDFDEAFDDDDEDYGSVCCGIVKLNAAQAEVPWGRWHARLESNIALFLMFIQPLRTCLTTPAMGKDFEAHWHLDRLASK